MSETDDLGTWLKAIHQAIKEHSESVTKYQQAETSQREQQAETELKTVVRLPIEVAEYPATDATGSARLDQNGDYR